jgi:prepilin-type N-terminal cleavage/methylation domain-containing protein
MMRNRSEVKPSKVRRGVSLVELTITMTIGGLVLATGIGMLHLMLRTDKTLAESLWRGQTVSQLSEAFRGDVHAAHKLEFQPPANEAAANEPMLPTLTLELADDHQVKYAVENNVVHRTETQADKTLQTNRFRFSPGTEIVIDVENANRPALVVRASNQKVLSPSSRPASVPMKELKIDAVLARDHRFENKPEVGAK